MKPTNQLKFKHLDPQRDNSINAILIYGRNTFTGKNRLVAWYSKDKGLEPYYDLASVLSKDQRDRIREIIQDFDPGAEVVI